jgi:hypothetical protein
MDLDLSKIDLERLKGSLGQLLTDALAGRSPLLQSLVAEGQAAVKPIIEGAERDLREFGLEIAGDMVVAKATGNEAWIAELRAQIRAIGERTRVRVDVARWAFAENLFEVLFRAAAAAVGAVKFAAA